MAWLEKDPARRCDPRLVLPDAKSVVMLATNYFQGPNPATPESPVRPLSPARGRVARYAHGADYHNVLRKRVRRVETWLEEHGGEQKSYTDTGPVLERDFAALAGLGWQGKSTLLLNERLGTWFFLSAILTTLEIEPDSPATHRCGTCTRCITACPTNAIVAPYTVDARRCISFLTIENREGIPLEFRRPMGDRIFGCDDCLDACPWNRFAVAAHSNAFSMRPAIQDIPLQTLLTLRDDDLAALIRGTPLARVGKEGLRRNICVALGNVGTPDDLAALRLASNSATPVVAEHALWAIAEIKARNESRDSPVADPLAPQGGRLSTISPR